MKRFAALLLVVFAGCSSGAASRVSASPTPARSAMAGRHNVQPEWYLRSISADGRTIAIVYTMSGVASGCEKQGTAFAKENGDVVEVHAVKSVIDDANTPCTMELGFIDTTVTLAKPLGSRKLVGCRPGKIGPSEDAVCRDLERGQNHGIPPSPLPAAPSDY